MQTKEGKVCNASKGEGAMSGTVGNEVTVISQTSK